MGARRLDAVRYAIVYRAASIDPGSGGSGWAEQTYGAAGSATFAGSYSYAAGAGPHYGGMQPTVSDDATALTTSEHVIRLDLVGGDYVEQLKREIREAINALDD